MSGTHSPNDVTRHSNNRGMAKTREPSIPATIRIPPGVHEYLTELAWEQRRSRSDLCAEILTDFVELRSAVTSS